MVNTPLGAKSMERPDRFAITETGQTLLQQLQTAEEGYRRRHKIPPASMRLRLSLLYTLKGLPKTSEELMEYFTFPERDWPKREEQLQNAATREFNWLLSRGFVHKLT